MEGWTETGKGAFLYRLGIVITLNVGLYVKIAPGTMAGCAEVGINQREQTRGGRGRGQVLRDGGKQFWHL